MGSSLSLSSSLGMVGSGLDGALLFLLPLLFSDRRESSSSDTSRTSGRLWLLEAALVLGFGLSELILAARVITTSGSHLGLFEGEGVIC